MLMGAVYKKKRRSCPMCKPHKMGWEPKQKRKYRQLIGRQAKRGIAIRFEDGQEL